MDLPALDCHAHISTSVTPRQLGELGGAVVFAMTRDLDEAFEASQRLDRRIAWACGAHPAHVAKSEDFDAERFRRRVRDFAVVGEVGLDRRSGNLDYQKDVFRQILEIVETEPVLVSIHSAGCGAEVAELIRERPSRGLILHWYSGPADLVADLVSLGCYFSLNSAMRPDILDVVPVERWLPETDFPVARKRTGRRPGDTESIETILAERFRLNVVEGRRQMYRNLRRASVRSGAIDRLPSEIVELLLTA